MPKERPTTTVQNPDGIYTILYGIHIKTQDPTDIPQNADAVFLETGMHSYLTDPLTSFETLKHHVQYRELFSVLEKKKIPVFFVDLKYRFPDPMLLLFDTAFSGMEWMAGMNLLKKKEGRKRSPFTLLVGAWLLLPFVSNVLRLGSAFIGKGQKQTGELKKFSHRLHPEADFLYLTLRNAVIAEKERYLMEQMGKGSHFVTVLGAGHVGIEDSIRKTAAQRTEFFRRSLPLIKKVVEKKYFYQAAEFRFNGKNWKVHKIHEIPTLKHLL